MPTVRADFVDRLEEIDCLHTALLAEGYQKTSFILVHGKHGLGKTQLLARYLRKCNAENFSIAYVDLANKDYLGLIDEVIEGLCCEGFESFDEFLDCLIFRTQTSAGSPPAARLAQPASGPDTPFQTQAPAITFNQPVTGENQTFISGTVIYKNPKITIINNLQLAESTSVQDIFQNQITRAFQKCLRIVARERAVAILLDHWDEACDPLKAWLNEHLIKWSTEFLFSKGLLIIAREDVEPKDRNQVGILPVEVKPFDRATALALWRLSGLPEEQFNHLGAEIYSIPKILAAEIDKQKIIKDLLWTNQLPLTPTR